MTVRRQGPAAAPLLQAAAEEVARDIHSRAHHARDGGIYWCQPAAPEVRGGPHRQLDSYLYPGAMGIALSFAAAGRILRRPAYRALALQAIAPLRRELAEAVSDAARAAEIRLPVGGFAGLGSLVYGLVRLGDVLRLPGLWAEAADLSTLISRERIGGDERFEVMTGSAGAILGLLALDERRPGPNRAGETPLGLAHAAAEHLLRHRGSWSRATRAETGAGRREGGPPPLGFCHGAAGILCALARLARRGARRDLAAVAREEWAGIAAAYDPEAGNWCLREHGGVPAGLSWCNGAAGIVLAGLEVAALASEGQAESLAGGLATLAAQPLGDKDHLCCGNLGRVDALLQAALRFEDERLLDAARSLALRVVARARGEGRYRLMLHPQELIDVRLFPGLAGVAYGLLRLVAPQSLPCLSLLG